MMVPFGFVLDILHALTECVRQEYKIELACRVIMFLTRFVQLFAVLVLLVCHIKNIRTPVEFIFQVLLKLEANFSSSHS